jgi:hypothetical protein
MALFQQLRLTCVVMIIRDTLLRLITPNFLMKYTGKLMRHPMCNDDAVKAHSRNGRNIGH